MRLILLTKGQTAIVDDRDFFLVSLFKWRVAICGKQMYAVREVRLPNGKRTSLYMHRFVLAVLDNVEVDHINGNTLDNRRQNLRLCSRIENCRNTHSRHGTSSFKGVHLHRLTGKWRAMIKREGRQHHLGLFDSEVEAARAYDIAALKYFGEFAHLNFPELLGCDDWRNRICVA